MNRHSSCVTACLSLPAIAGIALALSACAGKPRLPARPASASVPRSAPAQPPRAARDAADEALLQRARNAVAQARATLPQSDELEALLAEAQRAADGGNLARARSLADQALAHSAQALDAHYLAGAELELQKAQTYTGLSDAQLAEVRAAEVALARGYGQRAWQRLQSLNRQLAQASKRYVVAAGDSLWIISGKPEVYGNPQLWPLIWNANLDLVKDPNRLRAGQKLRIRANPSIQEVVAAVSYARSRSTRVTIGEVREAD